VHNACHYRILTTMDASPKLQAKPPYFSDAEFGSRIGALRSAMAERGLSACLISAPENVFYLTGLDHWGYFAPHILIVPATGELALVARAMERVTASVHVRNARFEGHSDSETAGDRTASILHDLGVVNGRVGYEAWSSSMTHGMAELLKHACPSIDWVDVSGLVDELRMIKSPAEQHFMREAARVSDAATAAAIEAVRASATERDVAAACQHAMIAAGGTYPGFGPFIRSTSRLGEEHTTWEDAEFVSGDSVFLELSGCVARYHAPLGRLVHIGRAPDETRAISTICIDAFSAACEALRPGALFRDVYAAWQHVVDAAGLAHYQRHHCGYLVGIGVPPSWTGGNKVTGLKRDSELTVETGMSFHVLSWLMHTGRGDFFTSSTVLLGDNGPEILTQAPAGIIER
jgi:Xaa-Pro dipeptidase